MTAEKHEHVESSAVIVQVEAWFKSPYRVIYPQAVEEKMSNWVKNLDMMRCKQEGSAYRFVILLIQWGENSRCRWVIK